MSSVDSYWKMGRLVVAVAVVVADVAVVGDAGIVEVVVGCVERAAAVAVEYAAGSERSLAEDW